MPGLILSRHRTPLGPMLAMTRGDDLCMLEFEDQPQRIARAMRRLGEEHRPGVHRLDALQAYFAGTTTAIDTIPVSAAGTPFQQRAWAALRTIPPGRSIVYAEQAARIGHPLAARAVGAANGANPVAIVLPCHRLLGARGALTGYGGGLDRKAWLLAHEAAGQLSTTP